MSESKPIVLGKILSIICLGAMTGITGYVLGNQNGHRKGYSKAEKVYRVTETKELLERSLNLNRKLVKELYGNDDRLPNLLNLDYKSMEE